MPSPLFLPLIFVVFIANSAADAARQGSADINKLPAETRPDTELLEFIAVFEPVDGAWVDPMHFYDAFESNNEATENNHE